ncbi:hypothetical protein DFH09DRAFT_1299281 [Mycena vulgaris]|nr:hypothetical protein DFH09DRAFT_1299281 [Mycena vulgaris]
MPGPEVVARSLWMACRVFETGGHIGQKRKKWTRVVMLVIRLDYLVYIRPPRLRRFRGPLRGVFLIQKNPPERPIIHGVGGSLRWLDVQISAIFSATIGTGSIFLDPGSKAPRTIRKLPAGTALVRERLNLKGEAGRNGGVSKFRVDEGNWDRRRRLAGFRSANRRRMSRSRLSVAEVVVLLFAEARFKCDCYVTVTPSSVRNFPRNGSLGMVVWYRIMLR